MNTNMDHLTHFNDEGRGKMADVEMEALTAVSAAALTVYDMCKAMQQDIVICHTMLAKSGGKHGDYQANQA